MKNKEKIDNPSGFKVGMQVKLPFGGWWFSKPGNVWVRGKIVKIGSLKENNKVTGLLIKCYHKKYGQLGNFMSLGEQCDAIYKVR